MKECKKDCAGVKVEGMEIGRISRWTEGKKMFFAIFQLSLLFRI